MGRSKVPDRIFRLKIFTEARRSNGFEGYSTLDYMATSCSERCLQLNYEKIEYCPYILWKRGVYVGKKKI